jgi:protein phosphatase
MAESMGAATQVRLRAYGRSDIGRVRADNQDRLLIGALDDGIGDVLTAGNEGQRSAGPLDLDVGSRGAVLLVADGMGGRAGGARASALALDVVMQHLDGEGGRERQDEGRTFATGLVEALVHANRAIFDAGKSDGLEGMGTTATLAGVLGDSVYVAQVGDSRAYLVRGGRTVRLTRDQSLVQDLIDSGILSEGDTGSVPNNVLLQALGARSTVSPDVTHHVLRRGDVLLLCSDGLSQMVDDHEIAAAAADCDDCRSVVDWLVGLANERGGPDNVTVLAARVEGDGLEDPQDGDELARRRWNDG